MEYIIAIIIAVLGSSGMWGLLQLIYKTKSEKKAADLHKMAKSVEDINAKQDLLCKAQKEIMQDRITYLASKYIDEGYISLANRSNLIEMYGAYEPLGEPCTRAVESISLVKNLPIKEKED